jgi:LacI family transcriptional regulator
MILRVAGLSDVARLAGVSVSVVSRVLNGDPALRAREETRERVRRAAAELNYTPNHAARALRLSAAGAIGLIVPDVTNAIFAEVMRGVEDAADAAGLQVLLGRAEQLMPGSDFLRRLLGEGRVDGFLIQRRDDVDAHQFQEIIEGNMPVVLVNSRGSRKGSVVLDDVAGAALGTEHLLALGHRRIALIGGDVHSHTGRQRERGFAAALTAAGVRRNSRAITHGGYTPQGGRESLLELMRRPGPRPSAVVVANVNAAIGVLDGARTLGIEVPSDLSVLAIHDTWVAEFSATPLTTVKMPLYELGRTGVDVLRSRMAGHRGADVVVMSPRPVLVIRESTAPPA